MRRILVLILSLTVVVVSLSLTPTVRAQDTPTSADLATVQPWLAQQLATSSTPVSMLIVLKDQPNPEQLLRQALGVSAATAPQAQRGALLYARLTAHAEQSQAELRAWLDQAGTPYRAFYIVNMIEVQGDAALAEQLRRRPEVARLEGNPMLTGVQALQRSQAAIWPVLQMSGLEATSTLPWGLVNARAPDVWALGHRGQGIVIASQDTGVQWDHPALQSRYRGWDANSATVSHLYNWFDAWGTEGRPLFSCSTDAQVPCDDHGHGTHTVGTMLGAGAASGYDGLGMAPDARWIGCRNMDNGVGTPASYTACFEFFLAPYPQGGNPFTDGHPELAPNIINNSWGCPPGEGCSPDTLRQVVETMAAAGQFVVASAGNYGSTCQTVRDPIGLYDAVFSVGAHDFSGEIASFSSRGPVVVDGSNRRKPDISAPGVGVDSAYVGGGYLQLQGTSMASPHVAGAVALLWSAVPTLTGEIALTEQVLIKSATPVASNSCGEGPTPVTPNNTYGFGRLNALAAVQVGQKLARLDVTVRNCDGDPLPGVLTRLSDPATSYVYTALTQPDGDATFPMIAVAAATETFTLAAIADSAIFTPTQLALSPGSAQSVSLQVATCVQFASVNITVSDQIGPVVDAYVQLVDVNTGNVYGAHSDSSGVVLFDQIFAGDYSVVVTGRDAEFTAQTITVAPGGDNTFTVVGKHLYKTYFPFSPQF